MIPFRPLYGQVHFILLANVALAALQNVTVDDSVSIGAVVPQYLPNGSVWNQGNTCTGCLVKPDPSLAYNGTWHDTTFSSANGFTQEIAFSFTGSALYIFFIIANTVPYATTFTDVNFLLDQVLVSTYSHNPTTSTEYQYNVPVYANDSLVFAEHNMTIQPITNLGNVLILFDYLIYTTDTSSSTSSSASATFPSSLSPTSTSSSSPASSGVQGTSSGQNIGAIVGGAVGGVAALVLVVASLLCYRRYKRRNGGLPSSAEGAVMDPFIEVAPTPLVGTVSSTHQRTLMGLPVTEPVLKGRTGAFPVTVQPSSPAPVSTTASSSGGPSSDSAAILEQVGMLRDEVARLRNLHDSDRNLVIQNTIEVHSQPPPEYSMDG